MKSQAKQTLILNKLNALNVEEAGGTRQGIKVLHVGCFLSSLVDENTDFSNSKKISSI